LKGSVPKPPRVPDKVYTNPPRNTPASDLEPTSKTH
jgi:hypothetical protein